MPQDISTPPGPIEMLFTDSPHCTVRRVFFTPEYAAYLVTKNVNHNRPVDRRSLERYIADMETGDFPYTGASICIDWDGRLIDGQHRLLACVQCGIGFSANLIENMDPRMFGYMDRNKNRTASDHFVVKQKMTGKSVSYSHQAATLAGMLLEEKQFGADGFVARMAMHGRLSADPAKRGEFAHEFSDDPKFRFAISQGITLKALMTGKIGMYCVYKMRQAASEKIAHDFITRLRSGQNMDSNDPARVLHDRLTDSKKLTKKNLTDQDRVGLSSKAFQLDRTGKTVTPKDFKWEFSDGFKW